MKGTEKNVFNKQGNFKIQRYSHILVDFSGRREKV